MIRRVPGQRPNPRPSCRLVLALLALAAAASSAQAASTPPEDDDAKPTPLIVMADFNRDGIPDKAEVTLPANRASGPRLALSLGQPDGTFKPTATSPALGPRPRSIVTGDFNRDGVPDLIVGDENGAVTLFLGDGTGNLAPARTIAHLDSAVSIAIADFNRDGNPDLAISDARASSVVILLSAGDGSFQHGWSFPLRMMGTSPHLAVADFNGDGIPDLAIVYDSDDEDTFDVMLGNGKGAFVLAPSLGRVRDPNAHCVT